ncbi:branched-chain amino acid ABC transporter permease, partial [Acinetobacter baumannii]
MSNQQQMAAQTATFWQGAKDSQAIV